MMTDEEKREALYSQLMEKMPRQERFMPAASNALADQGFGAAMAKAAAQAGTLGGKMADTSITDDSQAALRNNINMIGQDTSGADLKQKLYSDLGSKIQARNAAMQSSQDKSEKMAFDNKRLDADIGLKNAMLGQKNQPNWNLTSNKDADGNYIFANKTGETKPGPKAYISQESPSDKQKNKDNSSLAKQFESDYAKKTQISSVIQREVEIFDKLVKAGQIDQAVVHGNASLKALNSAFGADAVGVEEVKRLGSFLQQFKGPFEPGSMFHRDLDKFSIQLKEKAKVLSNAANDSILQAKNIRENGLEAMKGTASEAGAPQMHGESGQAIAAPAGDEFETIIQNGHTYKRNKMTGVIE